MDKAVNGSLAAVLPITLVALAWLALTNLKSGQKVLGKPRSAMIVSLLPKGDGRLAQG